MGRHPSRRHVSPEEAPVGRRIRQRRRELGLTQADLAGPEYTKSFISQLEGGYADPSLDTLRFLGRRLQMALSTMAGDAADQRLAAVGGLLASAGSAIDAGNARAARRAIDAAREIAADAGAHLYLADAALLQAELEIEAGDLDRAASVLEDIAPIASSLGSRFQSRRELAAGLLGLRRGDASTALAAFKRAIALLRKATRHPDLIARALMGIAAAATQMGDVRQARRRLLSAITIAQRHHLDALHGRALVRLAVSYRPGGADDQALQHLQEARRLLEGTGDWRAGVEAETTLGRLLVARGDTADAIVPMQRALAICRRCGNRPGEFEALLLLGRTAMTTGDVALAIETAGEARTLAAEIGANAALARASGLWGRAALAQARPEEAVPLLTEAITPLAAAGVQHELSEVATALGQFHRSRNEHDLAARYLGIALDATRGTAASETWPDLLT
ncbi:MAG: tetratricopeptide repeat protein [Armatimonadota bacterium]